MKASTVLVKRNGGALWAADAKAEEVLRKVPQGGTVAVRIMRDRSAKQNSLYWRALETVIEATGRWHTAAELHTALKIALGHVDVVQLLDGRRVLMAQSTSFDQMGQDEFQEFMDAALRLICTEILDNVSIDELLNHAGVKVAA